MAVALISVMMIRLVKLYYAQRPRARSGAYKNGAEYLLLNTQVQFKLNIYGFTTFDLFYIQNVFQHQYQFLHLRIFDILIKVHDGSLKKKKDRIPYPQCDTIS